MFQMNEVGRKIAQRRKEKNMTQMELADLMGVSFQAVSNWERGNSMPDIAKLPELSEWLGISIDELLTDEAPAKLVRHILEGDERQYVLEGEVKPHTVADVAPILRPKQTESLMEAVLERGGASVEVKDLLPIAPFVSDEFLGGWALQITAVDNIGDLVALAPFLSGETVDMLAGKLAEDQVSLRGLRPLAPFLSRAALDALAKLSLAETDLHGLAALAPFLSGEAIDDIVENIFSVQKPDLLSVKNLAPFLSQKMLDRLAVRAVEEADAADLSGLAPFLSQETLRACAAKLFEKNDMKAIKGIAPFL